MSLNGNTGVVGFNSMVRGVSGLDTLTAEHLNGVPGGVCFSGVASGVSESFRFPMFLYLLYDKLRKDLFKLF